MPELRKSIITFFNAEPRQKWFLIGYCCFIALFFFLRVARNNQEYLFFSGVLAALYYFYNNTLFSFNILKYVYLFIDVMLCTVFIVIGKETISMLFPLTTYLLLFAGRFVFINLFKREPFIDILLQKSSDRFYTLIMFLLIISSWVAIVVKFMDKKIV
jgi:hypothetical protein